MSVMPKLKWITVAVLVMAMAQPALAADNGPKLPGVWKLVAYEIEVQATGQREPVMGKNPTGYVNFMPEGRVFFVLTGEGRKPAKTAQDRAELMSTLVAYTGLYRIEGDQWVTKVEVAWDPSWVGTEQRRNFRMEGDRLYVLSPWRIMPNWADRGMTRSVITFERPK